MTKPERELARQLLAGGWSPVKVAHALHRFRVRHA